MTANQYRKQWLKLHRSYEKRAFRIFRKGLRKAARKIPFQTLDEWNYKTTIAFNIAESDIFESYYTAYLSIGTLYGNRVVRSIKKDTKSVEIDTFQLAYKQQLQAWLFENAGLKITTVKQSLIDYLLKEISNGLDEGYDIREMSRRIQKLVNSRSFYRWQAMRIARTETTAAANYGASVATEKSIYVLEKIWISSNDARTRQIEKGDKHDHMDMHLVKVEEKGVFNVQGDFLRFPGDPKGQASNVINCRCTVALKAKRDADGRLIRKGDNVNRFNPLVDNTQDRENTIRGYEKGIRNQSFESAGLFDNKGKLLFKKDGGKYNVRFNDDELNKFKGAHLTHNHPLDQSFSKEDIHVLSYHGLSEIRAVTSTRAFSMKVNKQFTDKREYRALKSAITRTETKVVKRLTAQYRNGEITLEEYKTIGWDETWKEFVKLDKYKDIFTYERLY